MTALQMYRGDDREFTFTFTETVDGVAGPMDLTGADVAFAARRNLTGATPEIVKATGGSGVAIDADPTTGRCTVTLEPADTAELGGVTLEYGVRVTRGGKTRTVDRGRLKVDFDVTTP